MSTSAPDQLWIAASTDVPTWEGFRSLAVLLAVCSRRVVGWSLAEHLRTELVVAALEMAVWNRRPGAGVIPPSDPGGQYTALRCGERSQAVGIRCSMGSVGDCYDNAMAERFFATLECELLARPPFPTHVAARTALFEYLAVFDNRQRRHSALGYLSPVTCHLMPTRGAGLRKHRLSPNDCLSTKPGQLQVRHAAEAAGITRTFLPFRAPELNPGEDLWRQLKGVVAANRAYATVEDLLDRALAWLDTLTPSEILRRSGLASSKFNWLPT